MSPPQQAPDIAPTVNYDLGGDTTAAASTSRRRHREGTQRRRRVQLPETSRGDNVVPEPISFHYGNFDGECSFQPSHSTYFAGPSQPSQSAYFASPSEPSQPPYFQNVANAYESQNVHYPHTSTQSFSGTFPHSQSMHSPWQFQTPQNTMATSFSQGLSSQTQNPTMSSFASYRILGPFSQGLSSHSPHCPLSQTNDEDVRLVGTPFREQRQRHRRGRVVCSCYNHP